MLWRYDGVSDATPLQRLRTAQVGADGYVFVNDGRGSLHALRIVNHSTTAAPTSSQSTSVRTQAPHSLAPPHAPAPNRPQPFAGVLVLLIVVGSALALFGAATLVAICILRRRMDYESL